MNGVQNEEEPKGHQRYSVPVRLVGLHCSRTLWGGGQQQWDKIKAAWYPRQRGTRGRVVTNDGSVLHRHWSQEDICMTFSFLAGPEHGALT